MRVVLGDGTGSGSLVEQAIKEIIEQYGKELKYYKFEKMDIKPCYNCGACQSKHPGRCAVKDGSDQYILDMMDSEACLWITPIFLGGYNSATKKAIDKLVRTGNPLFQVVEGRLQHLNCGNEPGKKGVFMGIGIASTDTTTKEREDFKMLLKENGMITVNHSICDIIEPTDAVEVMVQKIKAVLKKGESLL